MRVALLVVKGHIVLCRSHLALYRQRLRLYNNAISTVVVKNNCTIVARYHLLTQPATSIGVEHRKTKRRSYITSPTYCVE